MAHDPSKVPAQHADLFYHGKPNEDGTPNGLTDDQYDRLKARLQAAGTWPLDHEEQAHDDDHE